MATRKFDFKPLPLIQQPNNFYPLTTIICHSTVESLTLPFWQQGPRENTLPASFRQSSRISPQPQLAKTITFYRRIPILAEVSYGQPLREREGVWEGWRQGAETEASLFSADFQRTE